MSEPSAVKRPRRGVRKTARRNELTDELASGSEALDSRDAPSFSVQEDILVYRTEPGEAILLKEPDSDNEAQGTRHRGATPSMSQRVANAAQTAKDTVQDTLTTAIDQGRQHLPFNWPALLGLLLMTLLAGHGLSTLLRPHYKSDDISFFNRSIDQANHRYKQLGDYVAKTEGKLKDTEHRLKDAVKQVLHLQSSHSDSASHHSVLQDQMHKLSDKVSQATHFLGGGGKSKGGWLSKGSDSEDEDEHTDSSGLPSAVENPIKFLIHQQLEIFAADKTGLPDYANFHAGGRVIGHSQVYKSANPPFTHLTYWGCYLWPGCSPVVPDAAEKLLTPAMSPGQCFPLNGSTGYVDIHLHTPIAITAFSLEHIPSAIAYDITSAPNKVTLEALSAPQTHKVKGGLFTPHKTHGPFRYNLKANSAVQTFSIFAESPEPVSFVRLKVHSNHGHNLFTCLYRIRVHGEPV
ncbi:hypothetical protein ABBQ38_005169 [Trebouxia sp. C0009 RCD-2024]